MDRIIANRIFDNYSNDMEYWFDMIQGREEEAYYEILEHVKHASLQDKILMYITKTP